MAMDDLLEAARGARQAFVGLREVIAGNVSAETAEALQAVLLKLDGAITANTRQAAVLRDGELHCHLCQSTHFKIWESAIESRDIHGMFRGALYANDVSESDGEPEDERLCCQQCFTEQSFPAGLEVEYESIPDVVEDDEYAGDEEEDEEEEEEPKIPENGPSNACATCGQAFSSLSRPDEDVIEELADDGGLWRYCSESCRAKH
jgi:hypothetical protein